MIGTTEQYMIQTMLDEQDPNDLDEIYAMQRIYAIKNGAIAGSRFLSAEENKNFDGAIEIMTRIECMQKNKGWWYRAKARVRLTKYYMGTDRTNELYNHATGI